MSVVLLEGDHFPGIYLGDSGLSAIRAEPPGLCLYGEFHVLPEHPDYDGKQPGEWGCYKLGRIVAENASEVRFKEPSHRAHLPSCFEVPIAFEDEEDQPEFEAATVEGQFLTVFLDQFEMTLRTDRVSLEIEVRDIGA